MSVPPGSHGQPVDPSLDPNLVVRGLREVQIPGSEDHDGHHLITVAVLWQCRQCGGPRGEVYRTVSYDGSRQLACDGWTNPCGHIDFYQAIRREAAAGPGGATMSALQQGRMAPPATGVAGRCAVQGHDPIEILHAGVVPQFGLCGRCGCRLNPAYTLDARQLTAALELPPPTENRGVTA